MAPQIAVHGSATLTQLSTQLLGHVRFSHQGTPVTPGSRKGTALLAYLAMAGAGGVGREQLAELLWGPGRLANVRQELYALRKLPGAAAWLADAGAVVSVDASTDVQALRDYLREAEPAAVLPRSVELLPGLERSTTPAYHDWLETERAQLETDLLRAHVLEIPRLEASGRYAAALELVAAVLARDPLDEPVQRAGIRLTYRLGDPAGAVARYDLLRDTLRRELAVEPAPETAQLVALIRQRRPLAADVTTVTFEPGTERLAQALVLAAGLLGVAELATVLEVPAATVTTDLAVLERDGWLNQHLMLRSDLAERVASTLPVGTKSLLHERIATVLSSAVGGHPEMTGRHLLRGGRPDAAAPLLLAAASGLIARSAPAEAIPLLLLASWASWDSPQVRFDASVLLEGCASQLADEPLQVAALNEAEGLAWELQHDGRIAEVKLRRSRLLLRKGAIGDALEHALEALEIGTRLHDSRIIARARNAVGGAQFYSGDLHGAEASFGHNLTTDDPVERYRAYNNLGSIAGIRGNVAGALPLLEEALTLGRTHGQLADILGTLNNLAATADRVGDYRRAVKHFKESLTLARRVGSVGLEGQILVNLAVVYGRLGELGPAWNTAIEVEEIARRTEDARLAARAKEQQAHIASVCGDHGLALAEFKAAAATAEELGDKRKAKAVAAQLAVAAVRFDPDGFDTALSAVDELTAPDWADMTPWLLIELAFATGDAVRCAELMVRAAGDAPSRHMRLLVTMAEVRTGLLDGATEAHLEAAREAGARLIADEAVPLGSFECVERPHAVLLADLAARYLAAPSRQAAQERRPSPEAMARIRESLVDQGAGLPRKLAATLLLEPEAWLARLVSPR